MLRYIIPLVLAGFLVSAFFIAPALRQKLAFEGAVQQIDFDGDGINDVKLSKTEEGVVRRVEFKGEETKVSFSVDKGVKLTVHGRKFEIRDAESTKKAVDEIKKIVKGAEEENRTEGVKEKRRKKRRKEVREEGERIRIGKGNVTFLLLDATKNESLINADGDSAFEIKVKDIGNETVIFQDQDENGESDFALLASGRIKYYLGYDLISIDLNRDGKADITFDLNSGNYSINYASVATYLGKDALRLINLVKSGNFTPDQIVDELLSILREKDPELYEFVLKHKNDIFELLKKIKENAKIEESAVFKALSFSGPEDAIRTYYSLVCKEKDVSQLFSDAVDKETVRELHNAVYEAFDYFNCSLAELNCSKIKFSFGGESKSYSLCRYRFRAVIKDRKGRTMEIDKVFETLLDENNLIVWTKAAEVEE